MDERDDLMEDWDFDGDVLEFDPIYYPEPIRYLETKWQRPLDYHEKYLVAQVYNWCRNNIVVEEIKLIEFPIDPTIHYDSNTVIAFDTICHNEPIVYLSEQWQRPLTAHEMHIIVVIYDWCRTQLEIEEVTFLDDLWGGQYV